jgi:hypothetical protein
MDVRFNSIAQDFGSVSLFTHRESIILKLVIAEIHITSHFPLRSWGDEMKCGFVQIVYTAKKLNYVISAKEIFEI